MAARVLSSASGRITGGLRFERSDDFAFQNDLVSFRAIIRLDAELVDVNAVKVFAHSATYA